MSKIEEILKSKLKPKEKISALAEEIKKDKKFIGELTAYFVVAPAGEQGHLIEAMEYVSQGKPEVIAPHLDFVIEQLGDDAPRIKWECARIIANLAGKFPEKVEKAIPGLLKNSNDKGTVVRWSVEICETNFLRSAPS